VAAGRSLDEVEAALNVEMDRILEEPVSGEELEAAVKKSQAEFAYSSESVTNQGYWLGFSSIVADVDGSIHFWTSWRPLRWRMCAARQRCA
jgi:zinc protease